MKVSLNLIQFYNSKYATAPDPYSYGVDAVIERIGAQLGAVEEVIKTGQLFDGVLVVKIITCSPHPNADKLKVCMIDDGGIAKDVQRSNEGYVQVVCGAPNAREGITVAWLAPGSTVPSTAHKEPFVLGARELRGVMSNGMLASASELALSDDHGGILEIKSDDVGEQNVLPGTPFKNLYGLDDVIIDCENKMFTHRPDCFGTLGVAREIAGIFGDSYTSPEWYTDQVPSTKYQVPSSKDQVNGVFRLVVENNAGSVVPRFMCQVMSNVTVGPSPLWLQSYLSRTGSRSINNVVDYTNYFMMLTGQPLHAFDYDKVMALSSKKEVFGPRMARDNEKITLLNGKTVQLTSSDIVIAYGETAIALGGVMGGLNTEVDATTKTIILECATFDMYAVRRTSMRQGLFTDAVTRYTKGQSCLQNSAVLAKIADDLMSNGIAILEGDAYDLFSTRPVVAPVKVSVDFINDRLGISIDTSEITRLLTNVEFSVENDGIHLLVSSPFWRTDINLPEDIVEEVGRLYGYDKIDVRLPARPSKAAPKNDSRERASYIRNILKNRGANEVLGYSFVHGDLLKKCGQNPELSYHLRNAISPDLQYYRLSLTPSLLDKIALNLRSDIVRSDDNSFALFEINKIHMKGQLDNADHNLPQENTHVAFVFSADDKTAAKNYDSNAYYQALLYFEALLTGVNMSLLKLDAFDFGNDEWAKQLCAPYEPLRSGVYIQDGIVCGVVGEFKTSVKKALKLPDFTAGFEVGIDSVKNTKSKYKVLPTFPKTTADITFEMSNDVSYSTAYRAISDATSKLNVDGYSLTVGPRDIFHKEGEASQRFTFRIWLSNYIYTPKTEAVNLAIDTISKEVESVLDAKRI